jgi:hypothetical protein
MMPRRRSRVVCSALTMAMVALGLGSRRYASQLPALVVTYAGDTLWAAMVYFLAAMLAPGAPVRRLATGALAASVAVEVSQLVHVPWLDALRATRLGALVLGQGFLWSDLVCYAVGVCFAALLDVRVNAAWRRT